VLAAQLSVPVQVNTVRRAEYLLRVCSWYTVGTSRAGGGICTYLTYLAIYMLARRHHDSYLISQLVTPPPFTHTAYFLFWVRRSRRTRTRVGEPREKCVSTDRHRMWGSNGCGWNMCSIATGIRLEFAQPQGFGLSFLRETFLRSREKTSSTLRRPRSLDGRALTHLLCSARSHREASTWGKTVSAADNMVG